MDSLFLPIIDNGMGLSTTRWGTSMFVAGISGVFGGRKVSVRNISCSDPAAAMNYATESFLELGLDRMLVIDTDVIYKPDDLRNLLSHDVPLVAGLYPKKTLKLEWPVLFLEGQDERILDKNAEALVEVAGCAKGFTSIHRSVFETLEPHVPSVPSSGAGKEMKLYWRNIPGGMSEDYAFCYQYRDHCGKVFIDQRIRLRHEGMMTFPI